MADSDGIVGDGDRDNDLRQRRPLANGSLPQETVRADNAEGLGPSGDNLTTESHSNKTQGDAKDNEENNEEWETDDEEDEDGDDEGDESDVGFEAIVRDPNPQLPETVSTLTAEGGAKVYIVGTAHFSEKSQEDVAQTIRATQPNIVLLELCSSRETFLHLDEEMLLREAKNISLEKVRTVIRQSGVVQGILHILLLSMSAHITKELGMAPGGEFRRAFTEAKKVPGCMVLLGDRPIQVTLRRALGALSCWQKLSLAFHLLFSKGSITKEEVEMLKQKDLLEEMLREMTGEFPALSRVFVKERDVYLANSLRSAAKPIKLPNRNSVFVPSVVVGVVGIGHLPGIVDNWEHPVTQEQFRELLTVPPGSMVGGVVRWTMRSALVGLLGWGCHKAYKYSTKLFSR